MEIKPLQITLQPMHIYTYAKKFMVKRYGEIGEQVPRDEWHQKLGFVMDAYSELLQGNVV